MRIPTMPLVPCLNVERERACKDVLPYWLSASFCLPVQCRKPPQNAECKQCVTQAVGQSVGQSATIRGYCITLPGQQYVKEISHTRGPFCVYMEMPVNSFLHLKNAALP